MIFIYSLQYRRIRASAWHGWSECSSPLSMSRYATLLRATEDAEADYEERAHTILDGSDDWRAQAWRLERRLRETHGDIKQLNVTAQQGHTVSESTIREIGEDEMKQLAQLAFTGEKAG